MSMKHRYFSMPWLVELGAHFVAVIIAILCWVERVSNQPTCFSVERFWRTERPNLSDPRWSSHTTTTGRGHSSSQVTFRDIPQTSDYVGSCENSQIHLHLHHYFESDPWVRVLNSIHVRERGKMFIQSIHDVTKPTTKKSNQISTTRKIQIILTIDYFWVWWWWW